MNKILKSILIIIIVVASIFGGYFFGMKSGKNIGRIAKENEIKKEAENYSKSREAVKEIASKYMTSTKFADYKESYSYICPEFKKEFSERKYVDFKGKTAKLIIKEINIEDVVVNNDIAKIRTNFVITDFSLPEYKVPYQIIFNFINGEWCAVISDETLAELRKFN